MNSLIPNSIKDSFYNSNSRKILFFWIPILVMFLITNIGTDSLFNYLEKGISLLINEYFSRHTLLNVDLDDFFYKIIVPLKSSLFSIGFIMIIIGFYKTNKLSINLDYKKSITIILILVCLVSSILIKSMGVGYLLSSVEPFSQPTNWYYRRILVPFLSYFTHLNGGLYNVFHYILVLFLVALSVKFLNFSELWKNISIFTSGFIIFQFQFPGYVEILIGIFVLMIFSVKLTNFQKLILFSFSLITHESASIFMFIPIISLFEKKENIFNYLIILSLYILTVLMNFKFNFIELFDLQTTIGEKSSLVIFKENIKYVLLGVFFSYKFLWIFILLFIVDKRVSLKMKFSMMIILFFPLIQTFIAIDYSRLSSFGFISLFVVLKYINETYKNMKIINLILLLNLIIPSFYVGPGSLQLSNGLYSLVFNLLSTIVN